MSERIQTWLMAFGLASFLVGLLIRFGECWKMNDEEFAEWLKGCFENDEKARRLINGQEELPEQLTEDQRAFMQEVLDQGRALIVESQTRE
jgi:hypothetical protein